MRPLQGRSAGRGVGSYARGLIGGLVEVGFDRQLTLLLDVAFDAPPLPAGRYELAGCRRRYHGQFAAYEEAVTIRTDLERVRPDLYHAIDYRLPGRSPCPVVITVHDLIPWAWGGPSMRGERLRYWPSRRLMPRADRVIAVSEATAADAQRLARVEERRLTVIPEAAGPDFKPRAGATDRVRDRWGLEPAFLLFVGALDARKDPAGLMRAAEVAQRQLVVAGDPGRQAPASMPGARLLGRVTDAELADLYSSAGCLVFPSRYEGFGLPCLEAMACGCPVAAYRNSSLPEVVGDAGRLVDDGDATALGAAAAELSADPEPWRRAGLAQARKFSWRKTAEQTISVYESLLR